MKTTTLGHRFFRVAMALYVLAAISVARGNLDSRNPVATLYERPPLSAVQPAPPSEEFPRLEQNPAGYWLVDFRHLASFPFGRIKSVDNGLTIRHNNIALLVPDESAETELPTKPGEGGSIPANVRALDGRRVRIGGYMLPVRLEKGLVKECLLLRNQMMCCFGRRPEPNEWVVVEFQGTGVPSQMDTPIYFYGTLHVGEMFEHEVFEGLYKLDAEKVSAN